MVRAMDEKLICIPSFYHFFVLSRDLAFKFDEFR